MEETRNSTLNGLLFYLVILFLLRALGCFFGGRTRIFVACGWCWGAGGCTSRRRRRQQGIHGAIQITVYSFQRRNVASFVVKTHVVQGPQLGAIPIRCRSSCYGCAHTANVAGCRKCPRICCRGVTSAGSLGTLQQGGKIEPCTRIIETRICCGSHGGHHHAARIHTTHVLLQLHHCTKHLRIHHLSDKVVASLGIVGEHTPQHRILLFKHGPEHVGILLQGILHHLCHSRIIQ